MKSSKLFLEIKKKLKHYESRLNHNLYFDGNEGSIDSMMSKYNHDIFNEIMSSSSAEFNGEIDEEKVNDFKKRIDYFFSLYAPDDEEFKEFIKAISLYLTFIAKKPLHPHGIRFSNGKGVYKKQTMYYCTGKNEFMKDKMSLCRYCICKQVDK